jgi:hypothetical protein
VKDQRVTLDGLHMETLRGTVVADGFYETTVPRRPTFDIDFRLAGVDIPTAFAALTTVQKFVPVARWAQGGVSGTVELKGVLGQDMSPILSALTGKGAIETERLVVQGAPVLEKLADAVKLEQLRKPSLGIVRASFDVADGRLKVRPFAVKANGVDMTVAGSNGIDQSLAYDLAVAVPRVALGGAPLQVGAQVTGTVTNPTVKADLAGMAGAAREVAQTRLREEVATRTAAVREKVDSAAEGARRRAREEADRLVAEAEKQAASVRAEARTLAETTRREGNVRADSLLSRATNPMAKIAAQAATDRLRRETDQRAEQMVREADARADALVAAARQRADAIVPAQRGT